MKRLLKLLVLAMLFLALPEMGEAQSASRSVSPGKNPISWSGTLPIGTPATLSASFSPAVHLFIPDSGYAAPVSGASWTTTQNNAFVASFQLTHTFSGSAKAYPTYFQGEFHVQGGSGSGAPPMWEASGALTSTNSHSYFDIAHMPSSFAINDKDTQRVNDKVVDYAISGTQGQFISTTSTLPLASITYGTYSIAYSTPNPQTNLHCLGTLLPLQCYKMCKGVFEILGDFENAMIIHLPHWNQLNQAGPQTQTAWKTIVPKLLKHEQEHEKVFLTHIRNHTWWNRWAKTKREINVCVNDVIEAEQIAKQFLDDLKKDAQKEFNEMLEKYNARQQKVDQDEQAANFPVYEPMWDSKTSTLSNVLLKD